MHYTNTKIRLTCSALALALAIAACSRDDEHPRVRGGKAGQQAPPPAGAAAPPPLASRAPSAGELAIIHQRVAVLTDSTDRRLRKVQNLTRAERSRLRADVNAVQIARARKLGITPVSNVTPLVDAGGLIRLPDTTALYVLRKLNYSEPYVTPDASAMLDEIGRRFHERLDSLAIPRYRLDVTSVLRTPEKQAELRRRNSNASRIESAHEFGTTMDIAYRRFAAPEGTLLGVDPAIAPAAALLSDSLMIETGNRRAAELQAVLGRVLLEMRLEGKLMVMMERSQTVYHITVTRKFPKAAL